MGALLERLHHEHVERQRKWFPRRKSTAAETASAGTGTDDGAAAQKPSTDPRLIDIEIYRLVKRAEKIELMLAGRAPLEERLRVEEPAAPPTIKPPCRLVQRIVAQFYCVAMGDMLSHRRTQKFVRPRHIAMYLVQKFSRRSLPEIGRRFDHRDHTTVLHAVRKIERLRKSDPRMRDELQLLIMRICEATGCAPFEETPGDG